MGTAISKLRGTVHDTSYGKVLPAYHPASVLRKWNQRGVTILDLFKARREMDYPGIRLTSRIIWAEPSVSDCWRWWEEHGRHAERLAFDIETIRRCQISEIGFASSPTCALHIPFFWEEGKQYHNFYSLEDEVAVWQFVKHVLESDVPKAGQNCCQYDAYWLCKEMGIAIKNLVDDTMTMAHCWQPELEKSLGFLGSVFMDERRWKQIRKHTTKDVEKDNA
jgi:hypothetical protein